MSEQKIALVTGAGGALGKVTAQRLLDEGMKVILNDIDENKLREVQATLKGDWSFLAFDISDETNVNNAIKQINRDFGNVDILINNAGILSTNKVLSTTEEEWHRVLNVNLDGAFYLSRAVIPGMMAKRWGRIINTTSIAAKSGGITAGTAYSTSKGALTSLTFSLAKETAPYGITVNGIAPAYVKTPMTLELSEAKQKEVLSQIPVGRFCEPEEFAHVVMFLVHPLAGFITGEIIDLNGGLLFD